MGTHHRLDNLSESYCETIEQMQAVCHDKELNFRGEMMRLAKRWLAEHAKDDKRGTDATGQRLIP